MDSPRTGWKAAAQDLRASEKTCASRGKAKEECIWRKRLRACSWLPWFAYELNCLVREINLVYQEDMDMAGPLGVYVKQRHS